MPFSVILTEKGGATQRLDFESEEITIGRVDENDICLPKGNISKKHTKIVVKDGKIIVLDLKSTNGTYVNGKKLAGPQVIAPTDKVYIGDFILNIEPPDLEQDLPQADEQPELHQDEEPTDQPHYAGPDATRREGYPEEDPLAEEVPLEDGPEPEAVEPADEGRVPLSPVRKAPAASPRPAPIAAAPAKSPLAGAKAAAAKPALKAVPAGEAAAAFSSVTPPKRRPPPPASEEEPLTPNLVPDRPMQAPGLAPL